jgi:thiamine pyrophosphate-dependent acetolactate synthase large subunit-like protein
MRGQLFKRAKLIHCDTNHTAFHQNLVADQTVLGDARLVAEALVRAVPARSGPAPYREMAKRMGLSEAFHLHPFKDISVEGGLDPRAVCRRLGDLLPRKKTVVVDSGGFSGWPPRQVRFHDPTSLLWMNDFGTVGSGLGTAVGAALAAPDRVTALFVGDGGLMMMLGELDLAVRTKARLVIACMNDRAYGSELIHMADWNMPLHDSARFSTPDLAAVARSLGCAAERITRIEQIDALGPRIRELDGPLFLDCLLTEELVVPPSRRHI